MRRSRFLVLVLIVGNHLGPSGSLLVLELLSLGIPQCLDAVCWSRKLANLVGDLTSSNKRDDNGRADNEGENESVDAVPRRGPATLACTAVGVVEEVEGQELRDQGVFDREEDCGPCNCWCDDTDCVAPVALGATVSSPLKTPMNGTKERDDLQPLGEKKNCG